MNMKRNMGGLALAAAVVMAACDGGSSENVLAQADGHRLTTDRAVELLSLDPNLPGDPGIVRALADLWVDYVLLATIVQDDPQLNSVDLDPIIQQQVEQELVFRLRDAVIDVDTIIEEPELRARFEQDAPGVQVRARHILLTFPAEAGAEQRDSVQALAEELRSRAAGGEDFAALAQEYSQDPGSGRQGGDLGFFGRGQMVAPFEEAAFTTPVGELSPIVESPFGLHIIRVEERDVPEFDDLRDAFRSQLQSERVMAAESLFIAGIEEPANVEVAEGAAEVVRELARRPETRLSRRAGNRVLTEYTGGAFTAGEFQQFVQNRPPVLRGQIAEAEGDQIEVFLQNLTRGELLVNEARNRGVELAEAELDSLRTEARERLREAASLLALDEITPQEGESPREAIFRGIDELMVGVLQGNREVIPLGGVSFALRRELGGQVYPASVDRVVTRLQERSGADTSGVPGMPPGGMPPGAVPPGVPLPQPDTGGVQ
ncbi:MAG: peptidylprolyl isomerase [Gemmatimonadota bacterium]